MKRAAIIVASGQSRRMGFDKLSADLQGEPVLLHSVRAFAGCSEIVVVTDPERFSLLEKFSGKLTRVDGGAERADSVANGLAALSADIGIVAVHDGARPLVSAEAVEACFSKAEKSGAAALARRITETLKKSTPEGLVTDSIDRENLWAMETPQIFHRALLEKAYAAVNEGKIPVTDEVSALQLLGHPVSLVENSSPNLKITVPADLALARALLRM